MAVDLAELKAMIEAALPGAEVEVFDEDGGGQHLRAVVSAAQFEGLSRIDQHRLVKAAVKERFDDGTIHALSVKSRLRCRQKVTISYATRRSWFSNLRSMESMRSTWTDSRLDDFKDTVDSRLNDLNGRVGELSQRIDGLQHVILLVGGGLFAAFVGVMAALIGLIATQL